MSFRPDHDREEEYPGARWLRGNSPRAILTRLLSAHELEFDSRVAARLETRAIVLDPQRTMLRSMALTARRAISYRGEPPLDVFLADCIDRSIDDLIEEDIEAERSGVPLELHDRRYVELAQSLGVEPIHARRIAIVLNTRADAERRAAFAVLIQRKSLDEHTRTSGQPREAVRTMVRDSLRRLSRAFGIEIDPQEYGL
ncbi:MAG: hypothetical protein L6Q99_06890 [Planctomycetes bacterium]|nr:hypothetical protein [Planctomycetota bacterium]